MSFTSLEDLFDSLKSSGTMYDFAKTGLHGWTADGSATWTTEDGYLMGTYTGAAVDNHVLYRPLPRAPFVITAPLADIWMFGQYSELGLWVGSATPTSQFLNIGYFRNNYTPYTAASKWNSRASNSARVGTAAHEVESPIVLRARTTAAGASTITTEYSLDFGNTWTTIWSGTWTTWTNFGFVFSIIYSNFTPSVLACPWVHVGAA